MSKHFRTLTAGMAFLFLITGTCPVIFATDLYSPEEDSITMGAGYANDVYYSFKNGVIATSPRANWEIGFYTVTWSAGIITNGGNGVMLYHYPKADTSGWSSMDTTGLSTWPVLYDSPDEWEDGAFNRSASGHPDYGWGVYNTVNHNVIGDSLYIIKLTGNIFKKLWIQKKISIQNTYYFTYANLDGSDQVSVILNCNDYTGDNFVYYSLTNQEIIDREPASNSWDLLFTKYMGIVQDQPYPVTGVLNNVNIAGNRFETSSPDFTSWYDFPLDTVKSPVGYDWKEFDMGTFQYLVFDTLAYFIKDQAGDVNKLVFKVFEGSMSGFIKFEKSLISETGLEDISMDPVFSIYPNPANDFIHVSIPYAGGSILITDLSGKIISRFNGLREENQVPLSLKPGIYFISLLYGSEKYTQKLIIQE